jgi:hypothetical protein
VTDENIKIFGMKPIKEMTRDELIDEIIETNRVDMVKMELFQLRANVAQLRLSDYKNRLLKEAGLVEGPMGVMGMMETDDD